MGHPRAEKTLRSARQLYFRSTLLPCASTRFTNIPPLGRSAKEHPKTPLLPSIPPLGCSAKGTRRRQSNLAGCLRTTAICGIEMTCCLMCARPSRDLCFAAPENWERKSTLLQRENRCRLITHARADHVLLAAIAVLFAGGMSSRANFQHPLCQDPADDATRSLGIPEGTS